MWGSSEVDERNHWCLFDSSYFYTELRRLGDVDLLTCSSISVYLMLSSSKMSDPDINYQKVLRFTFFILQTLSSFKWG